MKKPTPNQVWLALFGIWGLFLTGIFSTALRGLAGPGVLQAIRLQNLLHSKNARVEKLQIEINELEAEATLIEKSPLAQKREIRQVLGYAAADEIIFDFSTGGAI
jgi:hypothetical protein